MAIKNELSKQLMSFATTLGTLFTLCIGGYLVMKGNLTIGTLVALQAYVAKLYSPAQDIADMAVDYKKISGEFRKNFSDIISGQGRGS